MRLSLAPRRLFGRVALLIVALAVVQFAMTILLFDRISRDSVREDHARRVAELLEVSERLAARDAPDISAIMTTRHLQVWVSPGPAVAAASQQHAVQQIAALVREWEPELASAPLNMAVEGSGGRSHLIGSMRLRDGGWLNFRSTNLSGSWPIVASASLVSLLTLVLCVLVAAVALRQLGAPLRRLAEATTHIGEGRQITVLEEGPSDLRHLGRAFNAMQARIARILLDRTKALVAISHDLRTPLARLKMASDYIEPEDMRGLVSDNADEMHAMIGSLQSFLAVEEVADRPERVVLVEVIGEAGAVWSERVRMPENAGLSIVTYPEVLRRALEPLIENAVRHGEHAIIAVEQSADGPVIVVCDQGPGIDPAHFPSLIEPFFRVDEARERNTPGFGLGIPRAHRLLQRFGGALSFRAGPGGGLQVVVEPPRPPA